MIALSECVFAPKSIKSDCKVTFMFALAYFLHLGSVYLHNWLHFNFAVEFYLQENADEVPKLLASK